MECKKCKCRNQTRAQTQPPTLTIHTADGKSDESGPYYHGAFVRGPHYSCDGIPRKPMLLLHDQRRLEHDYNFADRPSGIGFTSSSLSLSLILFASCAPFLVLGFVLFCFRGPSFPIFPC